MNRIIHPFYLLLVLALFAGGGNAKADDPPDTKGKDFWLTFLPNYHNNRRSQFDAAKYGDSLYIFITSTVPTSGTIEYKDIDNNSYTHNFRINDPEQMYIFKVSYYDFALLGYNDSGEELPRGQCELVAPQSFHVVSQEDINVYAHSQSVMTSDAFTILPTDALGENHFVMSYPSDGNPNSSPYFFNSTPSEFAIVAVEDRTKIRIIPSTETHIYGRSEQNIEINKGDVYLVQARIDSRNYRRDLTGTEIIADKPVAVFSGHQRVNITTLDYNQNISRDILIEQLPPVQSWGTNAILVPYPQPPRISQNGYDLYRIMAAYDNTVINIDDTDVAILDRGEFHQDILDGAHYVKSNKPMMVAQFKKSSQDPKIGNAISDPFMMIIPQVEQFGNFYRCINVQANEYNSSEPVVYEKQYITIVAPNTTLSTVEVDGESVSVSKFMPVPNKPWSYAWIEVEDGVHVVSAREAFGIYIYGYGQANSYGYFGGMNFKRLDLKPPEILSNRDCYKIEGAITDTAVNDSQINLVYSPDTSKINVTVNINSFQPFARLVGFEANLLDIYQDGEFMIVAEDSAGNPSEEKYEIPGFTVRAYADGQSGMIHYEQVIRIGSEYCFDITLENYGKFQHTVNQADFSTNGGEFRLDSNFPIDLGPGEKETVRICFYSDEIGVFPDTLIISDDCAERYVHSMTIEAITDDTEPGIIGMADSCNQYYTIFVTDSTIRDFGLQAVEVLDSVNCRLANSNFTPWTAIYKLEVSDPYKDAYFKVRATDSAGNYSEYEQVIPGYTLSFPDMPDTLNISVNIHDCGDKIIGVLACDTIRIRNYGSFPISFEDIGIYGNVLFSVPQSQFPVEIAPGSEYDLQVCFRPVDGDTTLRADTLYLMFNCITKKIALNGVGLPFEETTNTRCDVPVRFSTDKVPGSFRLEQSIPNPVQSGGVVEISVPQKSKVLLSIYDSMGKLRKIITDTEFEPGWHEVPYSVEGLPQGIYMIELKAPGVLKTLGVVVAK